MNHVSGDNTIQAATAEEELASRIRESLQLYLFDNARFLAERLLAERPDDVRVLRCHFCRACDSCF